MVERASPTMARPNPRHNSRVLARTKPMTRAVMPSSSVFSLPLVQVLHVRSGVGNRFRTTHLLNIFGSITFFGSKQVVSMVLLEKFNASDWL